MGMPLPMPSATTPTSHRLAGLGLVLNAVVLWNTRNLDAVVARLRAEGHGLTDEDVAHLSPLERSSQSVVKPPVNRSPAQARWLDRDVRLAE